MRDMRQALQVASLISAANITLHVRGNPEMKQWEDANLVALQRSIGELVEESAKLRITLSVENFPPPCFTAREQDLLSLLEAFPADLVGACIDAGHAHLGNRVVELARLLAPRAFVIHLHDNCAQGKDEHMIPGLGTIPWGQVVDVLRSQGFGGHLVFEVLMVETLTKTLQLLKTAVLETGLSSLVKGVVE